MPSSLFFVSAMDWIWILLKLYVDLPKAHRLALPDLCRRFLVQLSSDPVWRKKPNTHGNAPLRKFRQLHPLQHKQARHLSLHSYHTDPRDPITLPPTIDTIQLLHATHITNLTDQPYTEAARGSPPRVCHTGVSGWRRGLATYGRWRCDVL